MTEIKSIYEWKVALIDKSALGNANMLVHTYEGRETTALACAEMMTKVITDECKNSNFVVSYANFEYIGEEL